MVYRYVCEPCRQATGLHAERPYLNRIMREASKPTPEVVRRDSTGKPLTIGSQRGDVFQVTMAPCMCACVRNKHDPYQCTGLGQFKIGGRPGSGFVDQLAERLGAEPIPELVVGLHEDCQVLVTALLAWWFSSSDGECGVREAELESMKYEIQIKLLRDVLTEERPDLMAAEPYRSLKANLKKLVQFRNKVAHSRPIRGNFFERIKRVKGADEVIRITKEELAEHLDLAMALVSQLSSVPVYLGSEDGPDAGVQDVAA